MPQLKSQGFQPVAFWVNRWGVSPAALYSTARRTKAPTRYSGTTAEYRFTAKLDAKYLNRKDRLDAFRAARLEKKAEAIVETKFSTEADAAMSSIADLISANHRLQDKLERIQAIINEKG